MLLKLRRLCESYLLCLGGSCPVGQYLPSWLFFSRELPVQWDCSLLPDEPCIPLCQINESVTRIPSNIKCINECPIHRVLRGKMNTFYFSWAFCSGLSLTLSERSLQMDQAMTNGCHELQIENNFPAPIFVYPSEKKIDC